MFGVPWPLSAGFPRRSVGGVEPQPTPTDPVFAHTYRYISDGVGKCADCGDSYKTGDVLTLMGTAEDPCKRRIICPSCYEEAA